MYHNPATNLPAPRRSALVNRSPIYYGWLVMLAGTLGIIMTSPGQTYAVSIFIEHFITDLGISRSLVSTLYTVGTLVGSFALPLVGRQIDRQGVRRMVVIVSVLFGLACIYMGLVRNAAMLLLGFTAIRMLGQGSLGLVSTNAINQWWVQRRGLVLGISGVLGSLLGLGAFPNLINWLIPIYGWRTTYMLLGGSLLLIMAPLGLLLYRDRPEDYGLQPDGQDRARKQTGVVALPVARPSEEHWTLREAIRTSAFWILAAGAASISMLSTGLTFHIVGIFADNGLSAGAAAAAFVPVAMTAATLNLSSGILVDRIPVRFILAAALLAQALVLWMAQFLQDATWAVAYGIMLGVTMGLIRTVNSVSFAKYFGRRHLGSITGVTSTILIFGSALGPMPLGIARDLLGSYDQALLLAAILPLVLAVASLFMRKPEKVVTNE